MYRRRVPRIARVLAVLTTTGALAASATAAAAAPAEFVLVGAGDIASCSSAGDEATARILDGVAGTVFTAGDNAYDSGSAANYANCYQPSWGRHRARTRPVPGNHEYQTPRAAGYFGYFGAAAGDPTRGYYSYDLGAWHVVVVNSNCGEVGGCAAGSAQERWLRQDLAASGQSCTVAIWHHPLFTSGANHGPATAMRPIFRALYDNGAEVVLTGHNHQYERFAPQNPDGGLDNARGVRAFVVGTGGNGHYGFGTIRPNSQVRNSNTYGVLKLTLRAGGYDWQFLPQTGKSFTDTGSATCH
jgi:acid phosphatase type 7